MRRIQRDQRETQSIVTTTNSLSNFLISQSRKNLLAISFFTDWLGHRLIFSLAQDPASSNDVWIRREKSSSPPPHRFSLSHQITIVDIFYFLGRLYKPERLREERNLFSVRPVCVCWPVSLREEMLWAGMKVYLRTGGSGALSRQ